MPLETIKIILCERDWYLGGAQFLSAIAYPDRRDVNERERFEMSLVRQAIELRSRADSEWAARLGLLRPIYFAKPIEQHRATLQRGYKKMRERIICAEFIARPHVLAALEGGEPRVEGLTATVNNMALLATHFLGLSTESVSTFKSRTWAPSRPVVHAALAYSVYLRKLMKHPDVDSKLAFLSIPEIVKHVVSESERFRKILLQATTRFNFREANTIKFEAVIREPHHG